VAAQCAALHRQVLYYIVCPLLLHRLSSTAVVGAVALSRALTPDVRRLLLSAVLDALHCYASNACQLKSKLVIQLQCYEFALEI
jgi:hypothetical protein